MTHGSLGVQSTSVPDNQSTLKRQATFENQSGGVESSVGKISVRISLHSLVGKAFRLLLLLVILVGLVPASEGKGSRKSKRAAAPVPSATVGTWELSFNTSYPPLPAVHASVLPNGKVLHWGPYYFPPTVSRLWGCVLIGGLCDPDIPGNNTENIVYTGENLFCSGHSFLPDGRLFVAGGTIGNTGDHGLAATTIFNLSPSPASTPPANPGPTMNNGRWYPSNVTLTNGETAILSGIYRPPSSKVNVFNEIPEVLNSAGTSLRILTGAQRLIPLYPWIHVGTDGRVFYAGSVSPGRWLDTTGTGSWGLTEKHYYYSSAPLYLTDRGAGSSVMYDVNKVLIAGGGNPASATAETIDLTNETGFWQATGSMANARRHLNLTLLADGKVLATGGTNGGGFNSTCISEAIFQAELWNPATGVWSQMASAAKRRQYHSTAVLLLDGRVLAAGHTGAPGSSPVCHQPMNDEPQAEIFTPPYLFNPDGTPATRPTISWAPDSVTYGQNFPVTAPGGFSIAKVTLVRLSSVTHGFNMNQRFNQLTFSKVGGGLRVNAPASSSLAPPGHYMMFLINNSGVPSVAKVIQIL